MEEKPVNETDDLFRSEHNVDLILRLDQITYDAINHWRETKEKSAEQVAAIRDEHLVPAIRRLGRLCIDAVRFRNLTVYEEGLERLVWIYGLAKQKDLGAGNAIETSSVVPALYSMAQLYTVGAYASFRRRLHYLCLLLALQVQTHRNIVVPIWSHPHWYENWESDSKPSRFEQARKDVVDSPEMLALFLGDPIQVASSLSEFDFLVSFYLHGHKLRKMQYFTQLPKMQTAPIVQLLLNQDEAKKLSPLFSAEHLAEFLSQLNAEATYTRNSQWRFADWPKPIDDFLAQHPAKAAGA
ncbi:MAG: hypothetical protein M1132_08715 [Chloroflexi bacterium]|nr:hypothetical protein [Chloroflexota bacterium]